MRDTEVRTVSVGVQVGSIVDEVGAPSFFNAFFSTVVSVAEGGVRGSAYPTITEVFYQGHLPFEQVHSAIEELKQIRREFERHPPSAVVWTLDDPNRRPPWGDNISGDITSLGNYFVSSTGRDLFDLLFEALESARESGSPVDIVEL